MIARHQGIGRFPSEIEGQDNRTFYFKSSGSYSIHSSNHDTFHVHDTSGSGLGGVVGASSIDSGIDHTGEICRESPELTSEKETSQSRTKIQTTVARRQIEGGAFSYSSAHQTRLGREDSRGIVGADGGRLGNANVSERERHLQIQPSLRSPLSPGYSSEMIFQTFPSPSVNIVEAQGQVELEFVNPTFHNTDAAELSSDTTDSFTRL